MKDIKNIAKEPIFFDRNRVNRVYTGGMPYPEFFGTDEEGDNYFPEEWIASTVKAINKVSYGKRDGVSVIRGTNIFFDDLVKEHKEDILGNRKYDCLVKLLDSAVRLPVQVHPTKEFSRKNFNSEYGKTESWLVVRTRPNARMYFGFNDKYTKEYLSGLEEKSEHDKNIMESVVCYKDVKVGDVFLIKAGLIHAIGAGCTVVEVQEPTDFTIQPERWCAGIHLTKEEEFLSLDKDTALECFDYDLYGEKAVASAYVNPTIIKEDDRIKIESLISYNDTECFALNRYTLTKGAFTMNYGPSVFIVLEGSGKITSIGYEKEIKRGDYFFLPYAAQGKFEVSGDIMLVECLPSKQE